MGINMENIGGRNQLLGQFGSAIGWNEKCAAMSFSLFSLSFKYKLLVMMVSINLFWKSEHFDV